MAEVGRGVKAPAGGGSTGDRGGAGTASATAVGAVVSDVMEFVITYCTQ